MPRSSQCLLLVTLALGNAACAGAPAVAGQPGVQPIGRGAAPVPFIGTSPQVVNEADVRFMSGMIPHHAQAVKIAQWAETHTTRRDVRVLAARIVVAQRDEIELMQTWLRDRGQPVPAADATHARIVMGGMEHDMLMPGMLSDEELAQLNAARGAAFDRLFLVFMIRHHEGALTMVEELFGSHGAAQDEVVFRFASDVFADQTTEIDRMQTMLAATP